MNTEFEELEKENLHLKKALKKLQQKSSKKAKRKKGFLLFAGALFAGKELKNSIYDSIQEFNEQQKISLKTTSNLIASLVKRLTRIGVVALLIALLPTTLMIYQNNLLKIQNRKIQEQTFLADASRRSAQMFIMGDVMSDVNSELNEGRVKLSNILTGRVVSLSTAMKPYKYIDKETNEITKNYISPERGQLLVTLCSSNMNKKYFIDEILQPSNFSYSELIGANLMRKTLNDINLNHANLSSAELRGASLENASLIEATLHNTDLEDVDLTNANLQKADLSNAILLHTKLNKANMTNAILHNAKVDRADWFAYLKSKKVKGIDQLSDTYEIDSVYSKDFGEKVLTVLEK